MIWILIAIFLLLLLGPDNFLAVVGAALKVAFWLVVAGMVFVMVANLGSP